MEKRRIGIIGSAGKFGRWLHAFCELHGHEVRGADSAIAGGVSNEAVVRWADVVIIAVPPAVTASVIRKLRPHAKAGQLWMDVTSVKAPVIAAMPKNVDVVSLHPMCAPPVNLSLRGQVMVMCEVALSMVWRSWVKALLLATGAEVIHRTAAEHDQRTSIVQGLTHAVAFVTAAVMRRLNVNHDEIMRFASPVFRIALSWMGRVLGLDVHMCADIQFLNPWVLPVLKTLEQEARRFRRIVERRDRQAFVREHDASVTQLGERNVQAAFKLFGDLNQVMVDQREAHKLVFALAPEEDHPGALVNLAQALAEASINIRSIHSFRSATGQRLLINIDRPRETKEVKNALCLIAEAKIATEVVS